MQVNSNKNKASRTEWTAYDWAMKSLIMSVLLLNTLQSPLQAQEAAYSKPSFWIGAAGAANFNFYRGSTQQLNADFTAPASFTKGNGVGLFVAPLIEFVNPNTGLGVMLQVGYDNRHSEFKQVLTPCNCPADLATKLSYITVEPSLRVAPFQSGFYLFGGPRMAFNVEKAFTYKLGINPAFPNQEATPDVKGDLSEVKATLISMQIGAGFDIPLSSPNQPMQTVFAPFVSFQPYFGQSPRSIETWNITTLRVGAALKFGHGQKVEATPSSYVPMVENAITIIPEVQFYVTSPRNIPVQRRVRETFPLRNYVFFNLGSTEIPNRYVLLGRDQVKDFKENQLEVYAPKKLSGRSDRGMTVYYNVLNILGDRMGKNPGTSIVLVGSSEKGPEDGRAMAMSIQNYLVNIFRINESRISIEGRDKPNIPSEQPGGTRELELLREGDRRVSIESTSPELLMEFQVGPEVFFKPVEVVGVQEAPFDSYVSFYVKGAKEAFSSWSLQILDEKGKMQSFGPYTQENVSLPGKAILGTRPSGHYAITMIGKTWTGKTVKKETSVDMALWTPPQNEEGMRFSVIYEFNESKAIAIYEKYLTEVVIPKIPQGGTVIVHGHTDIIGDEAYNQKLSLARANDVKSILENGLNKAGRSDVKFEVIGSGEDQTVSPFENNYPEERFYNRTVIIDIIPRN